MLLGFSFQWRLGSQWQLGSGGWGCGARGLAFEVPLPCFHHCRNLSATKSTTG